MILKTRQQPHLPVNGDHAGLTAFANVQAMKQKERENRRKKADEKDQQSELSKRGERA